MANVSSIPLEAIKDLGESGETKRSRFPPPRSNRNPHSPTVKPIETFEELDQIKMRHQ
jgi:hypothetical protein